MRHSGGTSTSPAQDQGPHVAHQGLTDSALSAPPAGLYGQAVQQVSRPILTPLTYNDATLLVDDALFGPVHGVYDRLIAALMAVDVASRQQARADACLEVEAIICDKEICGHFLAEEIRAYVTRGQQ